MTEMYEELQRNLSREIDLNKRVQEQLQWQIDAWETAETAALKAIDAEIAALDEIPAAAANSRKSIDGVTAAYEKNMQMFKENGITIYDEIGKLEAKLAGMAGSAMKRMIDGVLQYLTSGINEAVSLVSKLLPQIKSTHGTAEEGENVSKFAAGGSFIARKPTLYIAGEAGPEQITVEPLAQQTQRRMHITEVQLAALSNAMQASIAEWTRGVAQHGRGYVPPTLEEYTVPHPKTGPEGIGPPWTWGTPPTHGRGYVPPNIQELSPTGALVPAPNALYGTPSVRSRSIPSSGQTIYVNQSTVTNGPTVQIEANYARAQSPSQIKDDVRLALRIL
jgi:hypothetical protein